MLVSNFDEFLRAESGAVVTDWVVLAAGVVGLGLATISVVSGGVESLSIDTAVELGTGDIIFESSNFGRSRAEVVALGNEFYTEQQTVDRYAIYAAQTEAELADSFAYWTNEATAEGASEALQAEAADNLRMISMVYDQRGLELPA